MDDDRDFSRHDDSGDFDVCCSQIKISRARDVVTRSALYLVSQGKGLVTKNTKIDAPRPRASEDVRAFQFVSDKWVDPFLCVVSFPFYRVHCFGAF